MVKSAEARDYLVTVQKLALAAKCEPIENGPVVLTLVIYRPRRIGDLSNRIKVLEDALQGLLYDDDSQVVRIDARRFDDKVNPRVVVTVDAAVP